MLLVSFEAEESKFNRVLFLVSLPSPLEKMFRRLCKQFWQSTCRKIRGSIFASYAMFKGKAALSTKPIPPAFSKSDSGGLKVGRRGTIMLTFWPVIGERKYDWEERPQCCSSEEELFNQGAT